MMLFKRIWRAFNFNTTHNAPENIRKMSHKNYLEKVLGIVRAREGNIKAEREGNEEMFLLLIILSIDILVS